MSAPTPAELIDIIEDIQSELADAACESRRIDSFQVDDEAPGADALHAAMEEIEAVEPMLDAIKDALVRVLRALAKEAGS